MDGRGGHIRRAPTVLHVDMDAFYAAVEQQHKPSLRGKAVVVGGVGLRGVVSTASYEARVFGVRSAMPTALARRLCPNAAYLYPRFGAYHAVSVVVMGLLRELSPLVEPVSLDEAFVDLAAMPGGAPEDEDGVRAVAEALRARIRARTGLTASVGAGTSKLIAKVASDAHKPDGLVIVHAGGEAEWLDPLPVRALWGVGPATAERLRRVGVGTVEQLRVLTEADLVALLGVAWGGLLYRLARGIDAREVAPEREAKSVSAEDTYPHDLADRPAMRAAVSDLTSRVVRRLNSSGYTGRTVTVKARGHDFTTVTRSETLRAPTDDPRLIGEAALRLLDAAVPAATASSAGIRLLGVGVSGLADFSQGDLIAELERHEAAARAAEAETEGAALERERTDAGGVDSGGGDALRGDGGGVGSGGGDVRQGTSAPGAAAPGDAAASRGPYGQDADGTGAAPWGGDLGALDTAEAALASGVPAVTLFGPMPVDASARVWLPGRDVVHARYGPGWVQGAGVGRVTIRFEGPDTPPGRIRTLAVDDPELEAVEAGDVARRALEAFAERLGETAAEEVVEAAEGAPADGGGAAARMP